MKIIEVTTKEQLKELYDCSAMTWEGLAEQSYGEALEACCKDGAEGTGYVTEGKVMNEICRLTGGNAYPAGLHIFSIKDFKGLAMQYGARWMDDIIDNNARREGWHPFYTDDRSEDTENENIDESIKANDVGDFDYAKVIMDAGYYCDDAYDNIAKIFGVSNFWLDFYNEDTDEITATSDDVVGWINAYFKRCKETDSAFCDVLTEINHQARAKYYDLTPKRKLTYYIEGYCENYDWIFTLFAAYYHDVPGKYLVDVSNRNIASSAKGTLIVKPDGTFDDSGIEYED